MQPSNSGKNSRHFEELFFETDDWDVYRSILPTEKHKVDKGLTFYIEGFNAIIRARVSRLVRKSYHSQKLTNGMI